MADLSNKTQVDLIITPGWVVTMNTSNMLLTGCSVIISNQIIAAIVPTAEADLRYRAEREHVLPDAVLMPGLVNTHCHSAMSLFRGFADDLPLQEWLAGHIWPAEEKWISPDFVNDGTNLAIAEMLLNGITCLSDMYFYPDKIAECMRKTGIRGQVAFPILEFPSAWARDADEYIHKGLELYDEYKEDPLISIAFGPHAPYTVADDSLLKITALAGELDAAIQIHLHESEQEISEAMVRDSKRPLAKLQEVGALSPLTQCVHMTQVVAADIETLRQTGAHVLHCPQSNMKLGNGFCPVTELLKAEINVGLGTDGAASGNTLDLFSAMNLATMLAKGRSGNPAAITIEQALQMATINGAKALAMAENIGSIEIGKAADLITVEMSSVHSQPLYNPLSQLVYTHAARQVSHVWVNGELLVEDGELTQIDVGDIIHRASYWQNKIIGS